MRRYVYAPAPNKTAISSIANTPVDALDTPVAAAPVDVDLPVAEEEVAEEGGSVAVAVSTTVLTELEYCSPPRLQVTLSPSPPFSCAVSEMQSLSRFSVWFHASQYRLQLLA